MQKLSYKQEVTVKLKILKIPLELIIFKMLNIKCKMLNVKY